MSSLLKLFSADRLKKGDLSTTNFFAKFKESLPTYLVCKTDAEYKNFYDLAMRAAYYMGLDDDELQRELSKIPEEEQSLQKFYEESCAAESRAKHFKDTQNRGHALDNSTNVNVAKSDTKVYKGKWRSRNSNEELPSDSRNHQNYADNKQKTGSQNHSNEQDSGTKPKKKSIVCNNCHIKGHHAQYCRKPGGGAYQGNKPNDGGAEASRVEISSDENGLSDSNYFYMRKIEVTPNKVADATAVCSQDSLKLSNSGS